ncbi:MAG: hypothetical protein AVDCRST_MAG40-1506 [uncultured Gemmatimonadaceae bacterium]|uniref:Lipoprotein n=1 Tax=uncultured Gemmatimonadaceae bacterium TaxID=246130 RepID=A0A6J4L8C7_9BACT|nr:MAG: hypothetical protein AVDCRST_MAG40-1506 [uncultured Gemmatimonadaceae bacterium]
MRRTPLALAAALLAAAACSSSTAPREDEEVRVLGVIAGYNTDDPRITVPATAERGVPFPVSVVTYGGGCYRPDDTEVRVVGPAVVEVAPYDFERPGAVCTLILKASTHTASVRFDAAGPAVVRIRGRQRPGDGELVVEREVLVR